MTIVTIIALVVIVAGAAVLAVGGVGLVRFGSIYTRLHALHAGVALGAPLMLLGLAIAAPSLDIAIKCVVAAAVIVALAPAMTQLLGGGARDAGETPIVGRLDGEDVS